MYKNKRSLIMLSSLMILVLLVLVAYAHTPYSPSAANLDECLLNEGYCVPENIISYDEYDASPIAISEAPLHYSDVDELLAAIGMAKFSEFAVMGALSHNSDIVEPRSFEALRGVNNLFVPRNVRNGFDMSGISVHSANVIALLHDDVMGNPANFIWSRTILPTNATMDFFGRGAIAEYVINRNGIDYYISEWVTWDTREPDGWVVAWAQNGQAFMASLPANFTLEDVLAFCDAQSLTSWELDGDAISVSVQGMNDVRIFDNSGGIAAFGSAGNEIIAIGNGLYRSGAVGFTAGGGMERVGYRWLIDEATHRYQYVLQPGAYEFHVTGNNGNGQPQFLVQHFVGGDRIAVEDQSFGQTTVGFSLTVTSGTEENGFMPPPTLFTTIFNEDWRTTINIRFFLNGVLTAIPIEDIQLIADGVHVAEIRDFTVNVAGWQTETTAIFINKLAPPWQNMTVSITAYGQTLTHHFVNNMFVPPPAPTHVVIETMHGWDGMLRAWCWWCCYTGQLRATVHPLGADQTVVWSSDTPNVVRVDQSGFVSLDICCCACCCNGYCLWCCNTAVLIRATAVNGVSGTFWVIIDHGIPPRRGYEEPDPPLADDYPLD